MIGESPAGEKDHAIERTNAGERQARAEIAGLTDESVCPTLVRKRLRFGGAGAFACQPVGV